MKATARIAAAALSVPAGWVIGYALATRRLHSIERSQPAARSLPKRWPASDPGAWLAHITQTAPRGT